MKDGLRVLQLMRGRTGQIVNSDLITQKSYGLGIQEVTGRIKDARKIPGCKCAKYRKGNPNCPADEHIICIGPKLYKHVFGPLSTTPRRGVQASKVATPREVSAPRLDAPEKPVKLEGSALLEWKQTLNKIKGITPVFEKQVLENVA